MLVTTEPAGGAAPHSAREWKEQVDRRNGGDAAMLMAAYHEGIAAAVAAADDRARAAAVGALHGLLLERVLPASRLEMAEAVLRVCAEPRDHSRGLGAAVAALVAASRTAGSESAAPPATKGIDEDAARELLAPLATVPPRCLFALCCAVLAGPAGDAGAVLWGPLQAMMAEAGHGTGLLAPGHPVSRKARAEALTLWFTKAARAVHVSDPPAVDLAASTLRRWMDECDSQAAAASTGNAAAHLPNVVQARLLRAGVAFAVAVDARTNGSRAVELVLEMLRDRPLDYRSTLDGWAAAITSLCSRTQRSLEQRSAVPVPASVQDVAPSLMSDLITFVTSGVADANNGLSGPAARIIAQLLVEDSTECKVMQQPSAKACGHGVRSLCAALLQGSASAHERLCATVIGPLCKSAPLSCAQLLSMLLDAPQDQGLGSALAVAAAAQSAGGKAATLVLERLRVDTIDDALVHADEGVRVAALKLCCQIAAVVPRRKPSNSSLNANSLLPVLQRRLRYCVYGIGAHGVSRQRHDDCINAIGLLLRQFHCTVMDRSNETHLLDLKPAVLEWATTVAKWCRWLRTWLFACLCPGAPFPRVSLTLAILHEHARLFWRANQGPPTENSDSECPRARLLAIVCGQRSGKTVRYELDALCLLLESTYPRIRELAYLVLLQLDVSVRVPHSPSVAERGYQLMSSLRLRQFDAGALLMRLLYHRKGNSAWWAAEFQGCTHRNPEAMEPTEALAMYTAWAFSDENTDAAHGSVRCLRYVLSDFNVDSYVGDDNAWSTPVGILLKMMCERTLTSLKLAIDQVKVQCESSAMPDDNSALLTGPMDLSDDRQIATLVLRVVELCRLIGALSERLGYVRSKRQEGLKLSHHFATSCLRELLYAVLTLPHMGAISGVAETLESVLAKLLRSDGCMPIVVRWREVLLENLSGPRILRRSTGMTTAVMALLRPLASQLGPCKILSGDLQVGKTLQHLLNAATFACQRMADSSQVAALDALTLCFRHRGIMVAAQTEATAEGHDLLPQALRIAITVQNSDHWAAQNSAAQLFDAVAQRLAGDGGLQVGNTEDSRTVSLASCLSAHPSLEHVILELIDPTQGLRAKFYVLLFLSLFKPSNLAHRQAETVLQAEHLLVFIGTCNAAPSIRLREAAAAALAALVPIECLSKSVETRVRELTAQRLPRSANYTHGLWLQVLMLVRSTRLYADTEAHAVHGIVLPLLHDLRVYSLMDPQSRKVALDIVYEFETRLCLEPSSGDCVDALVTDLVHQAQTTCTRLVDLRTCGLSKRLGVAAASLLIRRCMSVASTGEVHCTRNQQTQVAKLLAHQVVEVRHAAARQIKWIVKHRFAYSLEFARATHDGSHLGWLAMEIVCRIYVEVAAPVLKQLLRLLQELVQISETKSLAGVLNLAAQQASSPSVSLSELTHRLWAWGNQSEQSCTTTRALALEVLGCGRGQAKLSRKYDSVLLQTIGCVDWIEQLEDASDSAQQLYLRGHAAEALFVSGALDADMLDQDAQIRAWLLALALLQDDDPDVRECARRGLAAALMASNIEYRRDKPGSEEWASMSALKVMEAAWSHMTARFGDKKLYVETLGATITAGARAGVAPSQEGAGQLHDDNRLWDSNAEEGDNIFLDLVLQGQLASLQLYHCLQQPHNNGAGGVVQSDAATGMPELFLLSDEAQELVLRKP